MGTSKSNAVALGWIAIATLAGCSNAKAAQSLLPVGADAPDFVAKSVAGKAVKLSEQKGHFSVVYFYPKDETPGCTKEACSFRDEFTKFEQAQIAVFGVSRDTEESHAKFRTDYKLPFALAADPSGKVQHAYGVPERMGMSMRVTFLVGPDGKIAHVFPEVNPTQHADEVLAAVQAAQRGAPGASTKR